MTLKLFILIPVFLIGFINPSLSNAQDLTDVESLYDKFDEKEKVKKKKRSKRVRRKRRDADIDKLSDLVTLAPFNDVAVIQKRFLPKMGRFEFAASGVLSLNNAFFNNLGGGLRAGYYFTTKFGIELIYLSLSSNEKDATRGLKARDVKTTSLVTPASFVGGTIKWSPIYGKMSLMNMAVVPFDIYFSVGAGMTDTGLESSPTLHLGTGQIFALSKAMSFRWDFLLNSYGAKVASTTTSGGTLTQSQYDLFVSAGVSFFIPEAKYR